MTDEEKQLTRARKVTLTHLFKFLTENGFPKGGLRSVEGHIEIILSMDMSLEKIKEKNLNKTK